MPIDGERVKRLLNEYELIWKEHRLWKEEVKTKYYLGHQSWELYCWRFHVYYIDLRQEVRLGYAPLRGANHFYIEKIDCFSSLSTVLESYFIGNMSLHPDEIDENFEGRCWNPSYNLGIMGELPSSIKEEVCDGISDLLFKMDDCKKRYRGSYVWWH